MKYMTYPLTRIPTGVAIMLEQLGHDADDLEIILGMKAPWLLLKDGGHYLAGAALFQPRWLDLYLAPRGFHMTESVLAKEEMPAFLRTQRTAMLSLAVSKEIRHPAVFAGYEGGRYTFINVKSAVSDEPDTISLSAAMLLRRMEERVTVFTLEPCTPSQVDFLPLLAESLDNLTAYQADVMAVLQRAVTREEFRDLGARLFRALMQDMLPMAVLICDPDLIEGLRLLNHDYRHVFTRNSPDRVLLEERLPRSAIRECIAWLREDIVDQLYSCGMTDAQVMRLSSRHG